MQYIVKPPRSGTSGFAWHFDSQWLPNDVELHPYISVRVAALRVILLSFCRTCILHAVLAMSQLDPLDLPADLGCS